MNTDAAVSQQFWSLHFKWTMVERSHSYIHSAKHKLSFSHEGNYDDQLYTVAAFLVRLYTKISMLLILLASPLSWSVLHHNGLFNLCYSNLFWCTSNQCLFTINMQMHTLLLFISWHSLHFKCSMITTLTGNWCLWCLLITSTAGMKQSWPLEWLVTMLLLVRHLISQAAWPCFS